MKINDIPLSVLGAVRQNLGADGEEDTSKDFLIEKMTPKQIVQKYSIWYLGSDWAGDFIGIYENLKEIELESAKLGRNM